MSRAVRSGGTFVQELAMCSIQLVGAEPPRRQDSDMSSMAAGLPHFSVGWMRCWCEDCGKIWGGSNRLDRLTLIFFS